jgi:hypothetical protein
MTRDPSVMRAEGEAQKGIIVGEMRTKEEMRIIDGEVGGHTPGLRAVRDQVHEIDIAEEGIISIKERRIEEEDVTHLLHLVLLLEIQDAVIGKISIERGLMIEKEGILHLLLVLIQKRAVVLTADDPLPINFQI